MKILCAYLFLLTQIAVSQDFSKLKVESISSKDPENDDLTDLMFLKEKIGDCEVVLLGELEHGDGATFLLKSRIIKFLHQEMDFDVIAFEGGFYSIEIAESPHLALPYQWREAHETRWLFNYIESQKLVLTGFDSFDNFKNRNGFITSIDSLCDKYGIETRYFEEGLNHLMKYQATKEPSEELKEGFLDDLEKLSSALKQDQIGFWLRVIDGLSIQASVWWNPELHTKKNWFKANPRDSTMALNFKWLLEKKYQKQKIILWLANFHGAKDLTSVKAYKNYNYQGVRVMGDYLTEMIGEDRVYSIGSVNYQGDRTNIGHGFEQTYISPRHKKSLEAYLTYKGQTTCFVDFTNVDIGPFKMAGLAHCPVLEAKWAELFDAILFIDEMTPSTFPER